MAFPTATRVLDTVRAGFDGITIKSINEVSGLIQQDVVELKENGPMANTSSAAAWWPKVPDMTLTRGLSEDQSSRSGSRQPVPQDGRRAQGRRHHRLRLRGFRGQALQAHQRLAEEPEIGSMKAGDMSV